MQQKKDLTTLIRYVKSVGPKNTRVLNKVGIETVGDMFYYMPHRYEDRSNFLAIHDLEMHKVATIKGSVEGVDSFKTRKGSDIFQIKVTDGTGFIHGVWFNQPYIRKFFKKGMRVIMYGKVEMYDKLQINHPEYEILTDEEEKDSMHIARIVPIYHLSSELAQRYLRTVAYNTINQYARYAPDMLPTKIRARNRLVDLKFAISNIHFPVTFENLKRAYKRIVFDEFFLLQLAVALKKKSLKEESLGVEHKIEGGLAGLFKKNLPYTLTDGQIKAVGDIENDMRSSNPMNRLLEGDVGSGKTVVAAHAVIIAIQNGNQAAIMAPTEILAEQHFVTLSELFSPLGINVTMLISGMNKGAKEDSINQIASGEAEVVIGTHALIEENVAFKNLGLVVIDEQHKFGVKQRAKLQFKDKNPDVLLMTATPIPRSLALTIYGDLDISVIKELPPGRQPINTYWVEESEREKIYNFIKEEIASGRQAYIVYPRIEESGSLEIRSATEMHEELNERIFRDLSVELIHGKMRSEEKEKIMKKFKAGKIDILVSTVMIEVGIDVSNASIMLIENAERFGLSQLHQLRGRIGRGKDESYCILLANPKTEKAIDRLKVISESSDGFEIAEQDFTLRGPGELFGTKQHGLPEIKFGNVQKDLEIMQLARGCCDVLTEICAPDGFNLGLNIGTAAGAGIADHVHMHVVPRWNGDTNFMPVFADVKVIPEALDVTYRKIKAGFDRWAD